MDEWFNSANVVVIYLVATLLLVGGVEIGALLARLPRICRSYGKDKTISTAAASLLGLLALMIGFTFAMALSRFESRKSAVLEEANAIGTAALRGQMLADPFKSAVAPLFKDYANLRIVNRGTNIGLVEMAKQRSLLIQYELWRQAMAAAAAKPEVVPTGLFVQSLNDMIDMHEKRLIAGQNHVPAIVFFVLEGIAVVAMCFSGFGAKRAYDYHRVPIWTMAIVIGSVIMLAIDLDRPQGGFITVGQQPFLDLIQSMKSD